MLKSLFCLFDILSIIFIFATGNSAKELNLRIMNKEDLNEELRSIQFKLGSFLRLPGVIDRSAFHVSLHLALAAVNLCVECCYQYCEDSYE